MCYACTILFAVQPLVRVLNISLSAVSCKSYYIVCFHSAAPIISIVDSYKADIGGTKSSNLRDESKPSMVL